MNWLPGKSTLMLILDTGAGDQLYVTMQGGIPRTHPHHDADHDGMKRWKDRPAEPCDVVLTANTMWTKILLPLCAAGLALVSADDPLLPSQDAWYDQPDDIASYSPGDMIRTREVPPLLQPLFSSIPANVSTKAVYQYLYRTTDSLGEPVAAVVTLLEPYDSDPEKLVAYQTPYDSANPDCSPSYTVQARLGEGFGGFPLPDTNTSTDIPFIAAALNQGWWVLTTDYEGLEAQFTVGLQSGHATLDSIRVVLQEGPSVGLSSDARYALWGYSGGALASSWAAELQPTYAPELNFAGVELRRSRAGRINPQHYLGAE
ncbi:hypothetical protein FE257_008891 [Aspergillus nanangensis]|uniref:Uncharacterized protein n=1 Tax=Aspergillus nanangensis TaxID=2582783 RepID=A0AAD4GYM8_ASPNN|nr:hypothetical protein FE257_008891 [Aspergillus nanangensis]